MSRAPAIMVPRTAWQHGQAAAGERCVPEEVAVALTYNRLSYAVMMATPDDLEDFAIGFSLAEGIIGQAGEIEEFAVAEVPDGLELRMWLPEPRMAAIEQRRRRLAGPTGCGLCGLESLADAMRPPAAVSSAAPLHRRRCLPRDGRAARRAVPSTARPAPSTPSASGPPRDGLLALREDVGRHNALDKLAGALASQGIDAGDGPAAADQPHLRRADPEGRPPRRPGDHRRLRPPPRSPCAWPNRRA